MSFFDSIIARFSPPDPDYKQVPEGDPVRGKKIFQDICAECHSLHVLQLLIQSYDGDSQAPRLGKLFGRKTASTAFPASSALAKANFKWNEEHLFKFLRHPQKYVPGINMTWYGTRNVQERADLIAFLKKC